MIYAKQFAFMPATKSKTKKAIRDASAMKGSGRLARTSTYTVKARFYGNGITTFQAVLAGYVKTTVPPFRQVSILLGQT